MTYSQEKTVAALTDFYQFLVDMWMPPEAIAYPPEGGWPEVTDDLLAKLGKNATVARLAKHIPYVSDAGPARFTHFSILPGSYTLDYRAMVPQRWEANNWRDWRLAHGDMNGDFGPEILPLVNGGAEYRWNLLLDTKNDVVLISDWSGSGWESPSNERQIRSPGDESPELDRSQKWRRWQTYATLDFFEELKNQYRRLHWIPIPYTENVDTMVQWDGSGRPGYDEEQRLRNIFLRNGWPTENYNKEKCLEEVFNLKGQIDFELDRLSHCIPH